MRDKSGVGLKTGYVTIDSIQNSDKIDFTQKNQIKLLPLIYLTLIFTILQLDILSLITWFLVYTIKTISIEVFFLNLVHCKYLLFCNRGDTIITAVSDQGSYAKPHATGFLTPRQALASHCGRVMCSYMVELIKVS